MWLSFLAIGVGAALGAWLRYGLSLWLNPVHNTVPLGTLTANLLGGAAAIRHCRKPEIVADAAHAILTEPSREFTGRFCIDEDILRAQGVTDFQPYAVDPNVEPGLDLFVS